MTAGAEWHEYQLEAFRQDSTSSAAAQFKVTFLLQLFYDIKK